MSDIPTSQSSHLASNAKIDNTQLRVLISILTIIHDEVDFGQTLINDLIKRLCIVRDTIDSNENLGDIIKTLKAVLDEKNTPQIAIPHEMIASIGFVSDDMPSSLGMFSIPDGVIPSGIVVGCCGGGGTDCIKCDDDNEGDCECSCDGYGRCLTMEGGNCSGSCDVSEYLSKTGFKYGANVNDVLFPLYMKTAINKIAVDDKIDGKYIYGEVYSDYYGDEIKYNVNSVLIYETKRMINDGECYLETENLGWKVDGWDLDTISLIKIRVGDINIPHPSRLDEFTKNPHKVFEQKIPIGYMTNKRCTVVGLVDGSNNLRDGYHRLGAFIAKNPDENEEVFVLKVPNLVISKK